MIAQSKNYVKNDNEFVTYLIDEVDQIVTARVCEVTEHTETSFAVTPTLSFLKDADHIVALTGSFSNESHKSLEIVLAPAPLRRNQ